MSRGRLDFVRLLLDDTANPNISDRLHQTPLDLAVGHAASRNHLGPANRSEAVEAKRSVALAKNCSICDLLRSQGGKKTADIEREKMDAKIQTQKNNSVLDRSRQNLQQSNRAK